MKKELFINEVSKRIFEGKCDLFIGSGVSRESQMPSWKELLQPLAENIGIVVEDEDDLPMLAQYIVNENSGNKNFIYSRIRDCCDKRYTLNRYHYVISDLNINTVWTTNYDELLEECFQLRKPRVIRCSEDLSSPIKRTEMMIIKLHGCIKGNVKDIVLTQQEYDEYLSNKTAIAQKLRDSFIQRNFLFIGYGYRDPNIRNIMIEATRQSNNEYSQEHYIILFDVERKENEIEERFNQRKKRFELWIKELNRIGIRELVVKNSDELLDVLTRIRVKSREKSIFVSGSHEKGNEDKYREYGRRLAKIEDIIMINGQNQGVGVNVVNGFMETAINSNKELGDVVKFSPNPYAANPEYSNRKELLPQLKAARAPLFLNTKLFVVFAGGMGTEAEFEVAKEKGCLILVGIVEKKNFENPLIRKMLEDEYCEQSMRKIPEYYQKLKENKVPELDDLIKATEALINDGEGNCNK